MNTFKYGDIVKAIGQRETFVIIGLNKEGTRALLETLLYNNNGQYEDKTNKHIHIDTKNLLPFM